MRPVEKKNVGDVINLFEDIDDMKTLTHTVQDEYKDYGKARKVLLAKRLFPALPHNVLILTIITNLLTEIRGL